LVGAKLKLDRLKDIQAKVAGLCADVTASCESGVLDASSGHVQRHENAAFSGEPRTQLIQ